MYVNQKKTEPLPTTPAQLNLRIFLEFRAIPDKSSGRFPVGPTLESFGVTRVVGPTPNSSKTQLAPNLTCPTTCPKLFFDLRVFVKDEPQQEEQEILKLKDT